MGAAMLLSVPYSITSYVDFEFAYAHKLLAAKMARARFFRVCTAFCATRLHALLPASTTPVPVIYFGLDLPNWNQQAPLAGAGVLVTAARLVEKKGLHLVPAALAKLQARGLTFTWRIAGDGPERARLQALVAQHRLGDRVVFLGACDNATVRRELMAADAALLPCILAGDGERDGIPIFLSEAMALGVPVVTTPISGIPEVVNDRDTGFFAAPGDSDALAATLAAVLGDPSLARSVGARGRAEVHRTQDVELSAAALGALIDAP
jgi:glycosyltransferase involved in cell wall biosynthesis